MNVNVPGTSNLANSHSGCCVLPTAPANDDLNMILPPLAFPVDKPPYNSRFPPAILVPVALPPLIDNVPPTPSLCVNLVMVASSLSSAPIVKVLDPIYVNFSRVLILGCEGADTVTADSDAPDKFPVKLFALISP